MKRALLISLAVAIAVTSVGAALTGRQVLTRIRGSFDRVNTFQASFDHTFVWKLAGQRQQMRGQFAMKKPNRFRIQTEAQTVVTDGRTVWSYSPATNQVVINDYDPKAMPLRPDNFLFAFPDERRIRYIGTERLDGELHHIVDMVPRDSSLGIRMMRVWLNDRTNIAKKVRYVSVTADTTWYVLRNVRVNPALPDSMFTFRAPRAAETLDFRASRRRGR